MEEYYKVTLKTSNDWYSGTGSRILVQLIDAGDASIFCATDDDFWAGTTQTISINSDTVINQSGWTQADFENFGDPTYILLYNEGGDEWHPEWASVEEMSHEERPHAVWGAHFAGTILKDGGATKPVQFMGVMPDVVYPWDVKPEEYKAPIPQDLLSYVGSMSRQLYLDLLLKNDLPVPYFITEGNVASANLIALASWESGSIYPIDRETRTVRQDVVGTYGTLAGGADVGMGLTAGRTFGAWWVDNVPAIGGASMIYSYSIVVGAGFAWADVKHTDRSGEIVDGKSCPYGQSATLLVGGELSASPSLSIAYTWL